MSDTTLTVGYVALALLCFVLFAVWKARDSGKLTLGDLVASLVLAAVWPVGAPLFVVVLLTYSSGEIVVWRRK